LLSFLFLFFTVWSESAFYTTCNWNCFVDFLHFRELKIYMWVLLNTWSIFDLSLMENL
jgi:hypothetical protein